MNITDSLRLLTAAQDASLPPNNVVVLMVLSRFTNSKWQCHPGMRTIAKLCALNKETIVTATRWLEDNHIVEIDRSPRKSHRYHILAPRHWRTVRPHRTVSKTNLSGISVQMCPAPPDTFCPVGPDSPKVVFLSKLSGHTGRNLETNVTSLRSKDSFSEDAQAHGGTPVIVNGHMNGSHRAKAGLDGQ